ncbi:MAG: hypothetical protein ACTSWK_00340 [Promethearchaeota archaeon]
MKIGRKVKVGNNLTNSYKKYGKNHSMEKMKGKIFEIDGFGKHNSIILKYNENSQFHFSKNDLLILTPIKKKRIKPELFNPDQLII